jgi:hypothetical protein
MPGETADIIDTITHYMFWREACVTFTRHACCLIRMAGGPVTPRTLKAFAHSAPLRPQDLTDEGWRAGYCNTVMKLAHARCYGTDHHETWKEAFRYIAEYVPSRTADTAEMLIESVHGVISGMALDPPPGKPVRRPRSPRWRWPLFLSALKG